LGASEKASPIGATDIAALTAAVSKGDAAAVEAFYRRYFDWLYAEARRATRRDEAFCLDVVHDAVLKIVRTIRPVEKEPQLLAWLRLVVQTVAFDLIRGERRRSRREASRGDSSSIECAATAVANEEQAAWLREQLTLLDPHIVQLIELRYTQRWTLQRIAQRLGLSVATVDGRLRRALERLREAAVEVGHV
jgi:RNA polymerase sigma factor (sigma-70 family)